MLGGVEVTAKAREHAREMLAAASGAPRRPAATGEDTVRQPRPPSARRR